MAEEEIATTLSRLANQLGLDGVLVLGFKRDKNDQSAQMNFWAANNCTITEQIGMCEFHKQLSCATTMAILRQSQSNGAN